MSTATYKRASSVEHGSLTLPLLISTVSGVLFALLFANLVRYVGAKNAVEQAARHVSRCLTPTDAECVTAISTSPPADLEWFGVRMRQVVGSRYAMWNYQASLTRETLSAAYTSYLRRVVRPTLTYTTHQLDQYTYRNELSRYETRQAPLDARGREPDPVWHPSGTFPSYIRSHEEAILDTGLWQPYTIGDNENPSFGHNFTRLSVSRLPEAGFATIASGDVSFFQAGPFTIPPLPHYANNPNVVGVPRCVLADNTTLCPPPDAGPSSSLLNWYNQAYVAIKADAIVKQAQPNNSASIRWGRDLGRDGLRIVVYGKDGEFLYQNDLGGRDFTEVRTEPHYRNLVVRGPRGAHGGNPNDLHQALHVPRGGSFYVQVWLNAHNGPVDAAITLTTYYDEYRYDQNFSPATWKSCGIVALNPNGSDSCPTDLTLCGFKPNSQPAPNQNGIKCRTTGPIETVPSCNSSPFSYPVANTSTENEILSETAVVCSTNWRPDPVNAGQAPVGRKYCGWNVVPGSRQQVTVGNTPAECSAPAMSNNREYPQQFARRDGIYGTVNSIDELVSINNFIDQLAQPHSAPMFDKITDNDLAWSVQDLPVPLSATLHPTRPGLWTFSWTGDTTYEEESFPVTLTHSQLLKTGQSVNNSQTTSISHAWAYVVSPNGKPIPSPFLTSAALEQYVTYSSETQREAIDTFYPFKNKPEIAICPLQPEESLEDRFRQYIAQANPLHPGANPLYQLTASETYIGEQVFTHDDFSQLEYPPQDCTPFESVTIARVDEIVPLGTFSSAAYPAGPPTCSSYAECQSSIVLNENSIVNSPLLETNEQLAKAVGLSELQRFDKGARIDCVSAASCAQITIDSSAAPMAQVSVSYDMPLSFPFDAIVGRETLTINHTKQEVMELQMAGR